MQGREVEGNFRECAVPMGGNGRDEVVGRDARTPDIRPRLLWEKTLLYGLGKG